MANDTLMPNACGTLSLAFDGSAIIAELWGASPWGQRDIRVYDPDKHIVEIAENMNTVIKRFFSQGMSAEEVAKRTMFPLDVVKQYASCFDK